MQRKFSSPSSKWNCFHVFLIAQYARNNDGPPFFLSLMFAWSDLAVLIIWFYSTMNENSNSIRNFVADL